MKRYGWMILVCVFLVLPIQQVTGKDRVPITVNNLGQLTEVASMGKGTIRAMHWTADNRYLIVIDDAGFYFYESQDFQREPRFMEDVTGLLRQHYDFIFSPDGQLVVGTFGFPPFTGGSPLVVTELDVWNLDDGSYYVSIPLPETGVALSSFEYAVFSPDSSQLLISTKDGALYQWEVAATSAPRLIAGSSNSDLWGYRAMLFSSDGHWLVRVHDGVIEMWDATTWQKVADISDPSIKLPFDESAFALSKDGTRLLVQGVSERNDAIHVVTLWSVPEGKLLAEQEITGVTVVGFDSHEVPIVIRSEEATNEPFPYEISLLELETGIIRWAYNGWSAYNGYLVPQANLTILYKGGGGGVNIGVYDLDTGAEMLNQFSTMALETVSPNGEWLAIAGNTSEDVSGWNAEETELRVFDLTSGALLFETDAHAHYRDAYSIHSDSSLIGIAEDNARVLLWDTSTWEATTLSRPREPYMTMPRLTTLYTDFVESQSLLQVQVASSNGTLLSVFYDTQTREVREDLLDFQAIVSPNKRWIVRVDNPFSAPQLTIRSMDDFSEAAFGLIDGVGYMGNTMAFSSDSSLLAVASTNHVIYLWDMPPFESPHSIATRFDFNYSGQPSEILISPTNQLMAISMVQGLENHMEYNPIEIIDLKTGEPWANWDAEYPLRALRFSPDGRYLATVGRDDYTLRFWDAQTGVELVEKGSLENVLEVTFAPDGRLLLIETAEILRDQVVPSGVSFWDLEAGRIVGQLEGHAVFLKPRFSEDMTLLTVESTGRRLMVYEIE